MASRRPGAKPLSEPMMVRLPTHICVTRPQWVNGFICFLENPYFQLPSEPIWKFSQCFWQTSSNNPNCLKCIRVHWEMFNYFKILLFLLTKYRLWCTVLSSQYWPRIESPATFSYPLHELLAISHGPARDWTRVCLVAVFYLTNVPFQTVNNTFLRKLIFEIYFLLFIHIYI